VDRLPPPSQNTSSYTPLYSLSPLPGKFSDESFFPSLCPRAFNPRSDPNEALSFPERDKAESNGCLLKEQ